MGARGECLSQVEGFGISLSYLVHGEGCWSEGEKFPAAQVHEQSRA